MITAELEAAYRSTHYVVDADVGPDEGALFDPIVLEVDVPSPASRVRHQMQFLRGFSVEMPMKSTSWLRAGKIA